MWGITQVNTPVLGGKPVQAMATTRLFSSRESATKECYSMRRADSRYFFAVVWLGDPKTWKVLS